MFLHGQQSQVPAQPFHHVLAFFNAAYWARGPAFSGPDIMAWWSGFSQPLLLSGLAID